MGKSKAGSRAALCAVVLLAALAHPAAAHTPGAAPVVREGTVLLGVGPPSNEYHVTFEQMGFPIGAGDTFEISWSANGGVGPDLTFEIHTHEAGFTRYYNTTSPSLNLTWQVPKVNGTFMVDWINPWSVPVNLSYRFIDKAPPPDITPLIVLPIAVGAAFGWFLWLRSTPDVERQDVGGRRPREGAKAPQDELDDEAFSRAVMDAEAEREGSEATSRRGP